MIMVFLAGAAGFFVFDIYRAYADWKRDGHFVFIFAHKKGMLAHASVYFAAGLLGFITNIDTLYSESVSVLGGRDQLGELTGPILRAFSLGILGPAGLKRAQTGGATMRAASDGVTIEETPVSDASFSDYIRYFLMR